MLKTNEAINNLVESEAGRSLDVDEVFSDKASLVQGWYGLASQGHNKSLCSGGDVELNIAVKVQQCMD